MNPDLLSYEELHTAGMRHAFDLLGMWIAHSGAQTIRLDAPNPACIEALRLRLPHGTEVVGGQGDMRLFLFRPPTEAGAELHLAGCLYNAGSYRRLLRPSLPVSSLRDLRQTLKSKGYHIQSLAGIYPPAFLLWLTAGLLAGVRFPPQYFHWTKRTEETISTTHPAALPFCHLLVYYARRNA
jgi:hypothetical protein